jgi:hypothetical protein
METDINARARKTKTNKQQDKEADITKKNIITSILHSNQPKQTNNNSRAP